MKTTIKNILVPIALLGTLTGCDSLLKPDLDNPPKSLISDAIIFEDESLVESFLADIYETTLFRYNQTMSGYAPHDHLLEEGMGAVAKGSGDFMRNASFPLTVIDEGGAGPIDYWPYDNIRAANIFINGMNQSGFDPGYIAQKVGEARFLRAYMYFQMVRRYGGVPIITEPQSSDTPIEELYVSRDSEQAVYDFIASEMDAISEVLPETDEPGRAAKYAALALKSRAMLYAGSIGQFGEVQTVGSGENQVQLGISNPDTYWQASFDASLEIIDSENFSLFNAIPDDPAENFEQLFIEESNNPERIFVLVADPTLNKGHSWSNLCMPSEAEPGWGTAYFPLLHTIEEFEYADGSPGTLDRAKINSDELFDIDEVFRNKDPRFLATFFFPESEFQGKVITFHQATVVGGETVTSGTIDGNWPAQSSPQNRVRTGFLIRKMVDETESPPGNLSSDEDFMVFRYGEILLNYAEAAFYLGQTGEALNKINMIRERAGMPELTTITEEAIRHEREVELLFENHRYWDLRRWRIAHKFLDGLRGEGLQFTYHYDEDQYDFHLLFMDAAPRIFQQRHYYLPLGVGRIADNPNLVENPGY